MNTLYSYKRQEFQKILEINLCNYFGQSLATYLPKKILNMELNMMFWIALMEFALDIPEIYGRLLNTLQYKQDDKFDSLLVCNIMFRGSQQILLNRFCALALSNPPPPPPPPTHLFLTEYQAG